MGLYRSRIWHAFVSGGSHERPPASVRFGGKPFRLASRTADIATERRTGTNSGNGPRTSIDGRRKQLDQRSRGPVPWSQPRRRDAACPARYEQPVGACAHR